MIHIFCLCHSTHGHIGWKAFQMDELDETIASTFSIRIISNRLFIIYIYIVLIFQKGSRLECRIIRLYWKFICYCRTMHKLYVTFRRCYWPIDVIDEMWQSNRICHMFLSWQVPVFRTMWEKKLKTKTSKIIILLSLRCYRLSEWACEYLVLPLSPFSYFDVFECSYKVFSISSYLFFCSNWCNTHCPNMNRLH